MSNIPWSIASSDEALEFISDAYNRLEAFREGLGERLFDEIEGVYVFSQGKEKRFTIKSLANELIDFVYNDVWFEYLRLVILHVHHVSVAVKVGSRLNVIWKDSFRISAILSGVI